MSPDSRYVLTAEGIGKYFGRFEALKAASLWAEPGKVTTLMGRNGSGKTTLLRIAVGALRADRGVVSFLGQPYESPRLARMAPRGLFFLPQGGVLCRGYRVGDHFMALSRTYGSAGIRDAIQRCSVSELLRHRTHWLSGGEQRRVSLALAFARQAVVLVADEPLVGLTPRDQEWFGDQMRELASRGTAVVASGHDVRSLMNVSDVIIWSVAGTTHHLGSPKRAASHEQFRREYLGPGWAQL